MTFKKKTCSLKTFVDLFGDNCAFYKIRFYRSSRSGF